MDDIALEHRLTRIETKLDQMIDLQRIANGRVGKIEDIEKVRIAPLEFQTWKLSVDSFIRQVTEERVKEAGILLGKEALRAGDLKKLGMLGVVLQTMAMAVMYLITKVL